MFHRSQPNTGGMSKPLSVSVLGLKRRRTIICSWYCSAWYVACLGCYCTHVTWQRDTEGLLNWCTIEYLHMPFFLQWHLVLFPLKHGGGTYCDKCWPLENRHPVPKGWLCAVGTEDCLVLKQHSHWLRTDGMLKCLAFWQLGESQTLHKKSGNVCVPDMYLLHWNMKSSHNWTYLQFSQSVLYVGGIPFCLGMWSLALGCVFSKSLSYMVSLFRQFRCRMETVSPTVLTYDLFIDMHIPVIFEA